MSNTPEIEVVTTTLVEFDKVSAGIADLKARFAGVVFAVETTKGLREATEARAAVRAPRLEVERLRKAAKAPLLAIGKKLDGTAASITAELEAIEDPIDQQIKAEEARKEAEKAARVAAELERLERISVAIAEIANLPAKFARASSREIANARDALESRGLTTAQFEERLVEALNLKASVLAELDTLGHDAEAHEAEQARIVAERAELERLRLAEVQRQKDEAARLATESARLEALRQQQEVEAQRVRDEQAAAERKARQEREAADAAAKAERDAEEARIAAAAKKLADDQAEFARQQSQAVADRVAEEQRAAALAAEAEEAARIAAMPAPVPLPVLEEAHDNVLPFDAPTRKPMASELVEAVASCFDVPTELALDWLRTTDFNDQALPLALAA